MRRSMIIKRYLFTASKKERSRTIRIILGLFFSTMVLLCVLSIMEHLQSGRFSYIKKIRSFPVVIKADKEFDIDSLSKEFFNEAIVFEYKTGEGLLKIKDSEYAINIRYIDSDYEGGLVVSGEKGKDLLIPYRLFLSNRTNQVTLTTIEKGKVARIAPKNKTYTSFGFFQTALGSEFDSSTIFLPLDDAPDSSPTYIAFIPLNLSEGDMVKKIESLNLGRVITWQESESSLYGAMLLEKNVMSILLMSLFIIIAVQVYQNASAFSLVKRNELATLYFMGYTKLDIAFIAIGVSFLMTLFSFVLGGVFAKVFLFLISYVMPIFSNEKIKLDFFVVPFVFTIFTIYSIAVYVWAFLRTLKQDLLREVINTI